ncbi:hypothetical protein NX722_08030 [Endozoicomonas gorgoniicola]|uniref:Uncharacterized protein n=1 Tax=Endozoicomonas gorgoniicola TaxID=1234144 RepID=A0ABT3MU43_9GAMM|nr:tail fiber protein [Endozoicomonas gorgoniicola]MCW7552598.1 hypothetical protein [Endozoicomonas gorgoniicola]
MSLTIHQSGIDAAINAQARGFAGVTLNRVDLYNGSSKIKPLTLKGVQVIEPSRIYVVAQDSTTDVYDVTKMQFYTDGGVLFATAQNDDGSIIQSKAANATLLLAHQLNLSANPGTVAPSGDVSIYAPQATESLLGTAEIATQSETNDGTDDRRMVTPKKLRAWWDTVRSWGNITGKPSTFPPATHNHDSRYYTEAEMNTKLAAKLSRSGGTLTGNGQITWGAGSEVGYIRQRGKGELQIGSDDLIEFMETDDNEVAVSISCNRKKLTVYGKAYVDSNQQVFADNYHPYADKLTTARTISLSGDATGSVSFDGSANKTLSVTVKDDSHNHTIANVDGLQTALDAGTRQATENQRGQAEIATQAKTDAGTDDRGIVTPKTLKSRLASWAAGLFKSAAYKDAGQADGQVALIGDPATNGNTAVIVSSGSNANGHYRVYSDGFTVQEGQASAGSNGVATITLPIEMNNKPRYASAIVNEFAIPSSGQRDALSKTYAAYIVPNSTGSSVQFLFLRAGQPLTASFTWKVTGY